MSLFELMSLAALQSPSRLANPLCIAGLVLAFLGLLLAIFAKDIAAGFAKIYSKKSSVCDNDNVDTHNPNESEGVQENNLAEIDETNKRKKKLSLRLDSPLIFKIAALIFMLAGVIMIVVGV